MTASAPTSEVDICNLALDYLKEKPIASIDAPITSTEALCARWYHASRREVLRMHPWNFAKTRIQLSLNVTSPVYGYSNAYDLPSDFVKLTHIGDDSVKNYKRFYEMESGQILIGNSDAATLNIGYIKDQTDVNKFDAGFIIVLALDMAKNMAMGLTGKRTILADMQELKNSEFQLMASIDGQERPPHRIQTSKFLSARRRLTSNAAGPTMYIP